MPRGIKFPRTRLATVDLGKIASRRHHMAGLLELDVTDVRNQIRQHRRSTGESLSFQAWIVKAVSRTLEDFPEAHAFRGPGRSITVFEHIDITVMVERRIRGSLVPLAWVLRNTEKKTAGEISRELEEIRSAEEKDSDVVLGRNSGFLESLYFSLPGSLRRLCWKVLLLFPRAAQSRMGSAIITNVGAMGQVRGWFIPKTIHTFCVGVGSIVKKPLFVNGLVLPRDVLHMTVLIDHDVIDGAPMARCIRSLSRNIESPVRFSTDRSGTDSD